MFVVQIKRIHEYKRQLLACLELVAHYQDLKDDAKLTADAVPRTYVFAGKAAPGYAMAKLHIRLLNDVAAVINSDPDIQEKLRVVFIPNYGVSLAQAIIPAADISLQISQAGKEASGTSNMKLALNGALTVGTLDGANIELREAVGVDNFFLFGLTVEEVNALYRDGYHSDKYLGDDPALARAVALIGSEHFCPDDPSRYRAVVDVLRHHDHFMVCADFAAFRQSMHAAAQLFRDPRSWHRMAAYNVAGASRFSSDATIRAYAEEIWKLERVPVRT
jgi:starch phosphorylase